MNLLFLAAISLVMVGIMPAFAESQTHSTDGGTLDVKLDYDEIIPGELTTLRTDFINPQTQKTQVHIDWTFSVSKDGEIIWGPTQLSHTSEGFLKNLRYEFESEGLYTIEFGVEGILFQPIPQEVVSFDIAVGDVVPSSAIPEWIKNNAGWWADGTITDSDFLTGIQYLIQQDILSVPQTSVTEGQEKEIPDWIKNNAGWWSQGQISDDDFLNGIQYLIGIGLITVEQQLQTQTLAGEFEDADFIHKTSGTAIVTIAGDSKTLDLTNFETLNGPDLYVYMSADKSNKDFVELGRLDKFKGDQSYNMPDSVDIVKYHNVLIWCQAFGVLFGSAELSVVGN
ncbi:MAG: DM13 domain-containing protein [Nitrosopumilaceae archaeon]|uniref:DM13 domain-containing protein n=1 Tax=Candidatus Nitrosomaritimum aestuariumsis TaxID=3342354 RepID=A0AC60W2H0_9ARCH|nr:DM13 domain-containing protein [Nitrosopumilaceae archaeon]